MMIRLRVQRCYRRLLVIHRHTILETSKAFKANEATLPRTLCKSPLYLALISPCSLSHSRWRSCSPCERENASESARTNEKGSSSHHGTLEYTSRRH